VKDYVPVYTAIMTHNMWLLLIFRSVMVHVLGTYVFLSRTIPFNKSCVTHWYGGVYIVCA